MAAEIQPNGPLAGEKTVDNLSWSQMIAAFELRSNLAACQKDIKPLADASVETLAPVKNSLLKDNTDDGKVYKVGIIGAGVAGLFTAMLFDYMKEEYGLNVEYEILEANDTDRVGGRLFTKKFSDDLHDYYDVGAMRFPRNKIMGRTFELFEKLGMKETDLTKAGRGDLVQYFIQGKHTPTRYNDVTVMDDSSKVTAKTFGITELPEAVKDKPPGDLIKKSIEYWVDFYKIRGDKAFWEFLMKFGDSYSVRQYMSVSPEGPKYDYSTIEWLETANYGNRWYDQAFSEMLLEYLDFETEKTNDFVCVMGGAQEIAHRMAKSLKQSNKIECRKVVEQMDYTRDKYKNPVSVQVGVRGESSPRTYDAVFNSAPLGAMQHMKLEGLKLNWGTKQAIRNLGYGPSCKIGMKFKEMWWKQAPFNITEGGLAKTDLPIRCCVYPSYNIKDDEKGSGVLLVSYTWSAEAEKIGALMSRKSPDDEHQLKELVFHDLARLHTTNDKDYESLLERLRSLYVDHYAHNWYADPHSVGAFAYFGPGQYSNMYKYLTRSDGKHIIIGEAASAHHAWVVGALESAVRGVYQFCFRHSEHNTICHKIAEAYASKDPKDVPPMPFGPLPFEYDRTKECELMKEEAIKKAFDESKDKLNYLDKNVGEEVSYGPNGDLCRQGMIVEMIRQRQGGDLLKPEKVTTADVLPFLEAVALIGPVETPAQQPVAVN